MSQNSKAVTVGYWVATGFFSVWMLFTAYAQMSLPQVHQAFEHLGYPDHFRIELSIAKVLGVIGLLAPVPPRLKEWVYAGFTFNMIAAATAHISVGDGPEAFMWPIVAGAVLATSYGLYRRRSAAY